LYVVCTSQSIISMILASSLKANYRVTLRSAKIKTKENSEEMLMHVQ
jgi:hypothetical protein